MKIAIISDLHGNYEALRALQDDHDELWVLGDLVNYGPEPAAVVDFVRTNSQVVVRGNHDNSIGFDVDPRCTARYQKMADLTRRYSSSVLDKEQKQFLRLLPLSLEIKRDDTSFYLCHSIVAWQRLAEIVGEYVRKGTKLYVEGKLQTTNWQDRQSGEKKYRTEIVVRDLVMLASRGNGHNAAAEESSRDSDSDPAPAIVDEDIPF